MPVIKLPNNQTIIIKARPKWIDFFVSSNTYFTLRNTLYVSSITDISKLDMPLLLHENWHSQQQAKFGIYKWLFKYFTSKTFRLNQEAECYAVQIHWTIGIDNKKNLLICASKWLAGSMYHHCAKSVIDAENTIRKYCSATEFIDTNKR